MSWVLASCLAVLLLALVLQILFVLYVFSMNVQRVWLNGQMTKWHWVFCGFWIVLAIVLDVLLNYTVLAVLTLDFPREKEYTFSKRLERLVRQPGPIASVCRFVAFILNPFDLTGKHIK